ncbi:MAG TPA: hypothetical protein VFV99_21040 [Kofleriaceae bacterium]|nr:hypothetical protein [Kofleriaceae bacterium]
MPTEVIIRVFAHDHDLRGWLVDELALMSPTIEVQTTAILDAGAAQLLIVGLDALLPAELATLGALLERRGVPVIGIGTAPPLATAFVCVLDAKLTSKQLKRAVRDALAAPQ